MGLFKDKQGGIIELDDEFGRGQGYEEVGDSALTDLSSQQAADQIGKERGLLGTINAGLLEGASAVSLGTSDFVLSSALTDSERKRAYAERQAHPGAAAVGGVVGSLAAAAAAPGSVLSRTPAGYLAGAATRGAEAARALGGVKALVGVAAVSGAEAAAQNAGMYLGDLALGDRELTAEGMAGAIGTGFAFGSAGGAVAHGIEHGTIAARRLFSKTADATENAVKAAESAWSREGAEIMNANDEVASMAQRQLDEIAVSKAEAASSVARKQAELVQAKAAARGAVDEVPAPIGSVADEAAPVAKSVDEAIPTSAKAHEPFEPAPVSKSEPHPSTSAEPTATPSTAASESTTRLERELGEMKARVNTGESITDLNAVRKARGGIVNPEAIAPLGNKIAQTESKLTEALNEFQAAKADMHSLLERQLGATKQGLDAGRSLPELNAMRAAQEPIGLAEARAAGTVVEAKPLEHAYEDALGELHGARNITDREAAAAKVADIERKIDLRDTGKASTLDDIHDAAQTMSRYEKASAKLTEAVGDGVPDVAKKAADALGHADDEATRKMMDRMTRHADDTSNGVLTKKAAKERVAQLKAEKETASIKLAEIKATEAEHRATLKSAQAKSKAQNEAAAKAADAVSLSTPGAAKAAESGGKKLSFADKLAGVGEAVEMIGGIPGMPKPSDLPVVGPLLGMYLKFRAYKAIAGRLTGRIPATAEAKAASLASRTKDRVAKSVDRMLGVVAEKAPLARSPIARGTAILGKQIFDTGEPGPGKDAAPNELAAHRIREIAAYAANPRAIIETVRRELAEIRDPDLIKAAEDNEIRKWQWLDSKNPKEPPPSPLGGKPWKPSPSQVAQLARRLTVIDDPVSAFEAVEQKCITPDDAETIRATSPKLFAMAQSRLVEKAADVKDPPPYAQRMRMSLLFDVPLDRSLEPATLALLQTAHVPTTSPASPAPATPPTPSVAGSTNLTAMYQTVADRRAAAR